MPQKPPPNDGYTLPAKIDAKGQSPAFDISYRPAVTRELNRYRGNLAKLQLGDGDGITDENARFILEHLKGWTATDRHIRPWMHNGDDKSLPVAMINRESLELLHPTQLNQILDYVGRYADKEEATDSKNSASGSDNT